MGVAGCSGGAGCVELGVGAVGGVVCTGSATAAIENNKQKILKIFIGIPKCG